MYDICVIGSGWAGFNTAIRAKELGAKKVVLIEKENLGGTCLNHGCIPTKVLANSTKIFSNLKKSSEFGIEHSEPNFNFSRLMQRKKEVITKLQSGIQFILKQKNIEIIAGEAKLLSEHEVSIDGNVINADYIIIASGSKPIELPFLKFDNKRIISSDDILELDSLPKDLLIVGGGVIGCEFASIFTQLGTKVAIIELMGRILPLEDKDISLKLTAIFRKYGVEVVTNKSIEQFDVSKFSKVLVCVGRTPNTKDLNLSKIGIETEKNRIQTDEFLRTNIKNIYAVGDCTTKIMLAHVASMEGMLAAENIFLKPHRVDYTAIPNCIFTNPAIASCGISETKAKELGIAVNVGKFDFLGLGMAHILDKTEGFIKIIVDKNSQQIIGASILGEEATELISVLALAIQNKLTVSELQNTVFAHPTLSEAIWEVTNTLK